MAQSKQENYKLNILVVGAHPDDPDYKVGGTAYKWIQKGAKIKFCECFQDSEYGTRRQKKI